MRGVGSYASPSRQALWCLCSQAAAFAEFPRRGVQSRKQKAVHSTRVARQQPTWSTACPALLFVGPFRCTALAKAGQQQSSHNMGTACAEPCLTGMTAGAGRQHWHQSSSSWAGRVMAQKGSVRVIPVLRFDDVQCRSEPVWNKQRMCQAAQDCHQGKAGSRRAGMVAAQQGAVGESACISDRCSICATSTHSRGTLICGSWAGWGPAQPRGHS